MSRALCGHCGVESTVPWVPNDINCHIPDRSNTSRAGIVYATTCSACEREILTYDSGPTGDEGERVPIYPSQGELTFNIVLTLIIELENHRRQSDGEPPMTESERSEARENPDMIEKAKKLVSATALAMASGAAGGATSSVIAGLLGAPGIN